MISTWMVSPLWFISMSSLLLTPSAWTLCVPNGTHQFIDSWFFIWSFRKIIWLHCHSQICDAAMLVNWSYENSKLFLQLLFCNRLKDRSVKLGKPAWALWPTFRCVSLFFQERRVGPHHAHDRELVGAGRGVATLHEDCAQQLQVLVLVRESDRPGEDNEGVLEVG